MRDVPTLSFTTPLRLDGTIAAIPIDADPRAVFGRANPPVVVTINGYHYRSTIAIRAGCAFVPLRRSHRIAAGLVAGESYAVTLALDTEPRTVVIPDDLAVALERGAAMDAWLGLSVTVRREHVDAILAAKRDETRARRIAAAVGQAARSPERN